MNLASNFLHSSRLQEGFKNKEQASKNKSILNWAGSIPEGRTQYDEYETGTERWRRNSNGSRYLVGIVMRKAGAETDEIPETVPEIKKEKDIVPEGRTVLSNSSEQTISMVMRKALVQTDEIAENDIGPDGWKGTWDMPEEVRQVINMNPGDQGWYCYGVWCPYLCHI